MRLQQSSVPFNQRMGPSRGRPAWLCEALEGLPGGLSTPYACGTLTLRVAA